MWPCGKPSAVLMTFPSEVPTMTTPSQVNDEIFACAELGMLTTEQAADLLAYVQKHPIELAGYCDLMSASEVVDLLRDIVYL